MKFTDLFIRRPVLALVVNLIIVIAGVQAIRSLNVRQYPRSENAAITVTTAYVGANADLVRGFITTPLERVIASADGIDYLESESHQSVSIIRARLRLNYDSTKALAEIGSKVDQVRGDELLHARAGEVRELRRRELVQPFATARHFEAALFRDSRRRPLLPIALAVLARRTSARAHQIFDLMCPLRARITSTSARSKKFVLPRSFGSTRLS